MTKRKLKYWTVDEKGSVLDVPPMQGEGLPTLGCFSSELEAEENADLWRSLGFYVRVEEAS